MVQTCTVSGRNSGPVVDSDSLGDLTYVNTTPLSSENTVEGRIP